LKSANISALVMDDIFSVFCIGVLLSVWKESTSLGVDLEGQPCFIAAGVPHCTQRRTKGIAMRPGTMSPGK